MKKNQIVLSLEQRQELERFSETGIHSAKLIKRAKIILALDTSEGRKAMKQSEIAEQNHISRQNIIEIRKTFFEADSVTAFLQRKKRTKPPVAPKVTGDIEAYIIALACSKPPEGYARWNLVLLADRSVKLNIIDSLSPATVGRILKKRNFSLT